jgi:hypothetical protein
VLAKPLEKQRVERDGEESGQSHRGDACEEHMPTEGEGIERDVASDERAERRRNDESGVRSP